MGEKSAVIGFKAHTGWANYVAVGGTPASPEIYAHGRPPLLPDDGSVERFVYHEASQSSDARAREIVALAEQATRLCAAACLSAAIDELRSHGIAVKACALVTGSSDLKSGITLEEILKAHPLIHAAEGKLYRDAIVAACWERGIDVVAVSERDAWARAATVCRCGEDALQKRVAALRKAVGSPWGADEKVATAAALVAASRNAGASKARVLISG